MTFQFLEILILFLRKPWTMNEHALKTWKRSMPNIWWLSYHTDECALDLLCWQLSTQDEKRRLEGEKVELLQAQAKAEAAELSIRQQYNQLRSEKVCSSP